MYGDSGNDGRPVWVLGIDFGTSYSAAAIRVGGRTPEVIEIAGERRVPSVVLAEPGGNLVVGRAAEDMAAANPDRVVRAPKNRLGDPTPIVLAGRAHRTVDLVAALLHHVYAEALRHQGTPPAEVRLTHPAMWSRPRLERLLEAAAVAGLPEARLVPEPVAAAVLYADEVGVRPGAHVAVYDLGGGTFDTAVLRHDPHGFVVVGRPGGDATFGGELFDELVANRLGEGLAPDMWERLQVSDEMSWQRAAIGLRTEARRAKELLSSHPYADVLLAMPDGLVERRITKVELDEIIAPYIYDSVDVLSRCVTDAGLTAAQLDAIYLIGGSSRTPLVEQLVRERFPGVTVSRRGDPKTSVALGATLVTTAAPTPSGRTTIDPSLGPISSRPTVAATTAPGVPAAPLTALATQGPISQPTAPLAPPPLPPVAPPPGGPTSFPPGATAPGGPVSLPPVAPAPAKPANRTPLLIGAGIVAAIALIGAIFALKGDGDGGSATPTTTLPITVATAPAPTSPPASGPLATLPGPTAPGPTAGGPPPSGPPPTAPPPTAPPPTGPAPSAAQLRAALLTQNDVGAPFTPTPWTLGPRFVCEGTEVAIPLVRDGVKFEDNTVRGQGKEVVQVIEYYADAGAATRAAAQVRDTLKTCNGATESIDGIPAKITIQQSDPINAPGIDEVIAFALLGELAFGSVGGILVFARRGRIITQVAFSIAPAENLSDADTNRATALVLIATGRLSTLGA